MEAAVEIRDLRFSWPGAEPVLSIPKLTIASGERIFLQGPSGSGKSTLLGLIGGVLSAQSGSVNVLDAPLHAMRPAKRDAFRADHIGFVFQLFNLLPYLSIVENVSLPCRFSPRRRAAVEKSTGGPTAEAHRLLARLGLDGEARSGRSAIELSIGQQQRVAVARALIGRPELIIADEPTSALDSDTRARFIELLLRECEDAGSSVIFVSHDVALGPHFDRRIALGDINAI